MYCSGLKSFHTLHSEEWLDVGLVDLTAPKRPLLVHHVDEVIVFGRSVEELLTRGGLFELVEPSSLEEGGVHERHFGVGEIAGVHDLRNPVFGHVRNEIVDRFRSRFRLGETNAHYWFGSLLAGLQLFCPERRYAW